MLPMALDQRTLTLLFNRCNPEQPLAPDDERNVNIDAQREHVRGEPWIHKMANQLERSDSPLCLFFSGLRGSGKSTELRRLTARLEDPARAHMLPILVDAETLLDLSARIDVSDVLSMVLFSVERELLRRENKDPDKAMESNVFRRFWAYLTRTEVEFTKAEAGIQHAMVNGKLTAEMRANPTLRQKVHKLVANHLSTFIQEVYQELHAFEARSRSLGFQGLVVIVDSLEKLQGTSQTWKDVLDSAERMFANDASFLRLPVHVVYTFPPALTRRLPAQVYYLPMIKLHDRAGRDHGAGFETVRDIIRKRLSTATLQADSVLADMFGPALFESRLREIIDWSGGYPRELVRFLRALLSEETFPISEQGLQRLLRSESRPYYRIVLDNVTNVALTARIWVTKSLTVQTPEEQATLDLLLSNNVILRYSNDEDWVDVHPAVTHLEEIKEAAQKYRDSLTTSPPIAPPPATPPAA